MPTEQKKKSLRWSDSMIPDRGLLEHCIGGERCPYDGSTYVPIPHYHEFSKPVEAAQPQTGQHPERCPTCKSSTRKIRGRLPGDPLDFSAHDYWCDNDWHEIEAAQPQPEPASPVAQFAEMQFDKEYQKDSRRLNPPPIRIEFRRDFNNPAGLWATFVNDFPIHHWRENDTVRPGYEAKLRQALNGGKR